MFFRQLFLTVFIIFGFVSYGYADVPDIAPMEYLGKEIFVSPCDNYKNPDEVCKSYVVTPTNKICLRSEDVQKVGVIEESDNTAVKEKSLHEEANSEDAQNLQQRRDNSNSSISEPIDEIDTKKSFDKGPVIEE